MLRPKHILILFLLFSGCICNPGGGYEYFEGSLPEEPSNLEAVNTTFNDYNMASPFIENNLYLIFSSDRNSQGENFDIAGTYLLFLWNRDDGSLTVDAEGLSHDNDYHRLANAANSAGDELGPANYQIRLNEESEDTQNYLLYASNADDEFYSIYISQIITTEPETDSIVIQQLNGIDGDFDKMYPSFYGAELASNYYSAKDLATEVYFCHNAEGVFNIYCCMLPDTGTIVSYFKSDTNKLPEKISVSGTENDKCPFIIGNYMLFASDREGGFGGYDLYYSQRINGEWTAPKNLGAKINSEYNEYRPISTRFWEFENDIILFSSDRPGGKGGYDLYYAGTSIFREE